MAQESRDQSAIVAVADLLPRIRSVSVDVRSRSQTGWSGRGRGAVRVSRDGGDVLFEESGRFQPANGRIAMRFRNVLGWTIHADAITLSHRRHGPAGGTRLVELRQDVDSFDLVSNRPHRCGADLYSARLELRDGGFDLVWRVTGPRKAEDLAHRYRMASDT